MAMTLRRGSIIVNPGIYQGNTLVNPALRSGATRQQSRSGSPAPSGGMNLHPMSQASPDNPIDPSRLAAAQAIIDAENGPPPVPTPKPTPTYNATANGSTREQRMRAVMGGRGPAPSVRDNPAATAAATAANQAAQATTQANQTAPNNPGTPGGQPATGADAGVQSGGMGGGSGVAMSPGSSYNYGSGPDDNYDGQGYADTIQTQKATPTIGQQFAELPAWGKVGIVGAIALGAFKLLKKGK